MLAANAAAAGTAQYFYDPAGRLIGMLDTVNGTAVYSYDAAGNNLAIQNNAITAPVAVAASPWSAQAGASVTISGTFGNGTGTSAATTSNTTVKFNGISATVSSVSNTSVVAVVPSGAASGSIVVVAPNGTATLAVAFTSLGTPAAPMITSIPTTILAGGSSFTISGTNFDTQYSKVSINGLAARITAATATSLTVTMAFGTTTGHVTVETPNGSATSTGYLWTPPFQNGDPSTPYAISDIIANLTTTVGTAVTVSGFGPVSNIGLVAVDAPAGRSLGAFMAAPVNGNTEYGDKITVYRPDGTIVDTEDVGYGGMITPAFSLPSTQTKTYLIQIQSNNGFWSANPATITPMLDNSQTSAITTGGSTNAVTYTTPGQVDNLTFTGTAGARVSLYIEPPNPAVCIWLRLRDPNGIEIYNSSGFCSNNIPNELLYIFTHAINLTTTGTYTISSVLYAVGEAPSIYPTTLNFHLWTVPADVTGVLTANGSETPINFSTPGQVAHFTFQANAGDKRVIVVGSDPSDTFQCPYNYGIQIWGPNQTTGLQPDFNTALNFFQGCGGTDDSGLIANAYSGGTLPYTGTYAVYIFPLGGTGVGTGTGTSDVRLYTMTGDVSGSTTTTSGAQQFAITEATQGLDVTFAGTSGQAVTITVSGDSNFAAQCFNVSTSYPYQSGTQSVSQGTGSACPGSSGFTSGSFSLPATATYTVRVQSQNWATGNVTVNVTSP